jgi:hypothetical protein
MPGGAPIQIDHLYAAAGNSDTHVMLIAATNRPWKIFTALK